jgi:hypothetical protein
MTAWTCDRVVEELDLYAAGECDAAEQSAVETHLKSCGRCQANLQAARHLLNLLDLRAAEPARLNRLQALIRQEARQRRHSPMLTQVRRFAALAALLLIGVGLVGLPTPPDSVMPTTALGDVLVVEWMTPPAANRPAQEKLQHTGLIPGAVEAMATTRTTKPTEDQPILATFPLKTDGPAAAVALRLRVENNGPYPLTVRPQGNRTEVSLDLSGPGVQRSPMDSTARLALSPSTLRLQPGQSKTLTLERLTAGRNGAVDSLKWTLPGEYELTGTLRLEAWVRGQPAGVCEVVLPRVRLRIP